MEELGGGAGGKDTKAILRYISIRIQFLYNYKDFGGSGTNFRRDGHIFVLLRLGRGGKGSAAGR